MKTYLNNYDIFNQALENNNKFYQLIYSWAYDDNMFRQKMAYKDFEPEGIKYHGHYCSFYYTLDNAMKFIKSMLDKSSINQYIHIIIYSHITIFK